MPKNKDRKGKTFRFHIDVFEIIESKTNAVKYVEQLVRKNVLKEDGKLHTQKLKKELRPERKAKQLFLAPDVVEAIESQVSQTKYVENLVLNDAGYVLSAAPHALETIRRDAGLTQAELANKLKIHRPTLSRIERKEIVVTDEQAKSIADFFGIEIQEIDLKFKERLFAGRQFKAFREHRGLTQTDMANMTNKKQFFISNVENDKAPITEDFAQRIAEAFKMSIVEIYAELGADFDCSS